jgi:hypothetical protein
MAKENHILVGLGGTGGKVLKAFRKRLYQEFNAEQRAQLPIGFLYVDSSIEMMKPDDKTWQVLGENAQFSENEFVNVKGIDINAVLANPSNYPGLKGIIGDAEVMRKTLGEVGAAAAQKRRAGRILFGSNIDKYKQGIMKQFSRVNAISKASRTNIYIFTGLAGGTGSGSIIDVIAQTRMIPQFRDELSQDGKTGTAIVVNAMVPELAPPGTCDAGRYHANGYAAIQELNALLTGNFKPYDVSGQHERLDLDLVKKVADGLILYSNVNEHGYTVESLHELPQILADFTYSRIFLENNGNTEEFLRAYSFENINDWRVEYYEKAKNGAIQPYRTKAVSSFGFKRVIIPEEEIVEYFSFSFGRQSLLQMRYNNWNDDLGFRDTPANKDYSSEVLKPELQEKWRISDKHLMLELPVLPSDENKFGAFAPYWAGIIPRWAQAAEKENQPLAKLEELCQKGYNELFRQLGAVQFYEGKTAAREQHAQEICDRIERYIFDQWKMGDLSLYNMLQLIDCINTEVGKKRKNMEASVQKNRQLIDQLIQQRDLNKKAFAGVLIQAVVKGKYLTKHSTIMQQIMVKQCEVLGGEFAQQLLAALSVKLNLLRSRIESFVTTLNEAIEFNEAMIGARCQDEGGIENLQNTVIRFYDQKRVKEFTQRVITDQKRQKSIADEVRLKLVDIIGSEQTFQHANAVIDKDTIADLMDTVVRQKSVAIHEDLLTEASEKLINRNILEQLSERYSDGEELKKFAKSIIEESGVFLELNSAELQRSIGGQNPVPEQGMNINRKVVLINLPKVEGNETVQKFATKLKDALIGAVTAGTHVYVDMNGTRQNELTVQNITYCFPVRCLKNLAFYKERYDLLVNGNESRQMRVVLHGEGTGEDFPKLEVQGELLGSQLREMFMPYAIADYALDLIKYGDLADGTGRKAFGTVTKDPLLGLETLNALSDKFTGIGYSQKFTEDFGEQLKDMYEDVASTTLMNIELRKQTMIPKVQQLLGQVVLPECGGNQGSPEFLEFVGWTRKALAIIQDPTPIKRKNAPQQDNNVGGIDFSSLLS